MNDEEIKQLRELDAVSPAPWAAVDCTEGWGVVDADGDTVARFTAAYVEGPIGLDEQDAKLIAAARNAVPKLLAMHDAAQERIADLERAVADYRR